jgi:hypothetical protein
MQTELGGPIAFEPVPVHYAYVAKYSYTDIVVQNDNFLRLAAYADTYQTPGPCGVATFPEGRQVEYPDRLGNTVHRVRITAPHQGLIIAATGKVCLNRHTPVVSDPPLSGAEYGLEAQELLSASRLADPESVANAALEATAGRLPCSTLWTTSSSGSTPTFATNAGTRQ